MYLQRWKLSSFIPNLHHIVPSPLTGHHCVTSTSDDNSYDKHSHWRPSPIGVHYLLSRQAPSCCASPTDFGNSIGTTQPVFSSDHAATTIDKNCQHLRTADKPYLLDDILSATLEHASHSLGENMLLSLSTLRMKRLKALKTQWLILQKHRQDCLFLPSKSLK